MSLPRKIFLLTCFLFCLNGVLAQKIVKAKKVQVSNGLVCYKKSENPFTGTVTGDYLAVYGVFINSSLVMGELNKCMLLFKTYSDLEMFKDSEFSFKEGKLDGLSKIWAGNSISELNFNNGKLDGLITISDKEGTQNYQCAYANGNKNGLCKEWFSNGNQNFEGSYKDGVKEGLHIYWDENGDWTSIIDYVDGELNYIKKGDLSQKIIDMLPTKVSDIDSNNGKMCYAFTSILFSGIFQKFHYDGKLDFECSYNNGKKDGLYKQWHSNGNQKLEYSYNNGEKNGLYKEWHSNGNQKYEFTYANGEKDGLCKEWQSNGNLNFEGSYKDGEKDGLHIYWGENGDWTSIKDYVDGKVNYIEKGDLSQEIIDLLPTKVNDIDSNNGKMCYAFTSILFSGIFQKFHYDGKLDFECSYNNGKKDGLYKEWYQNGNQKFEYSYNNGEKDGLFMEWDTEGVMNLHKYLNGSKTPILKDDLNPELLNILNIPIDVNFSDLKKIGEIYCYEAIESLAFTGAIKEYYPNGKLKLEFNFLDGDFVFQKWYYANGYLAELADYKMREFKVYHKNGKLRYESENKVTKDYNNAGRDKNVYSIYINSSDKKGWHKEYHENGKYYKQFKIIESYSGYQKFNKDSLYKEWHSNGVLSKKCNYINGILEGEFTEWYKNGKLKTQASYNNAEKEGLFKEWHENGRLRTQTSYVNGEREGGYKEWHENGRLRVQTSYTNGTLEGSYKRWYSDGRLYEDTKYRSGVEY